MVDPRLERTRQALLQLAHRGLDVPAFFSEARTILARHLGFDGCCWLTFDPSTLLPTSHIAHDSIRPEDVPRLARNEYLQEDVNKFAHLAGEPSPTGILREATGGRPEGSARWQDILVPNGFGPELRGAFMSGPNLWGGAAMYRATDGSDFQPADAGLLAAVSGSLAQGLRRAILASAVPQSAGPEAPGLILLSSDDRVDAVTAPAERLLAELPVYGDQAEGNLPSIVYTLVARARRFAGGNGAIAEETATARIRSRTGRWLILHGSLLAEGDGRAAVIIEPARPPTIAPLIVGAYGLTERERDVTQLCLQGLSTSEIAATLFLSPYTVQDHLKVIFEKVGVRSRRELVADVFFRHYAPRLGAGDNLAADGWFAEAPLPSAFS